jgi:hypothetical protein
MGIDFRGIRVGLQRRLELARLRATLRLLKLLQTATVKLASPVQREQFAAEQEKNNQQAGEQWRSVHRQGLFANVGLALSQWAGMEDLLIAIASLLLRTHEGEKVGIIFYSIVNFQTWLTIIGELFSMEPRYIALKQKWNKISERLRGLKDTRDRLAHHTIYYGDKATTLAGETSLRPGRFDVRQKSKKFTPLDLDQIKKVIDSVGKVVEDLSELLNAMTALLQHETLQ